MDLSIKNKCFYCERLLTPHTHKVTFELLLRTRDHIIPKSKGGNSLPINMVYACSKCNSLKGNLLPEEFSVRLNQYLKGRICNHSGFSKLLLEKILSNNNILCKEIEPYRTNLFKRHHIKEPEKYLSDKEFSALLKSNTDKVKEQSKKVIKLAFHYSNTIWTQDQFNTFFQDKNHFHYL